MYTGSGKILISSAFLGSARCIPPPLLIPETKIAEKHLNFPASSLRFLGGSDS